MAGTVLEPIVVRDEPSRHLSIRWALKHVVVSEFEQGPGEPGPEPHVHHLHADCFYVLDGTLTLSLADGDREAGPGTFVLVPPDVAHTYRNASPDATRFLNFHAPGMSFDRYVLGTLEVPFDQHPPPEDGGADPASVLVRTAETEGIHVAAVHIGFLAKAEETLGALGLVEYAAPPSFPGLLGSHSGTWNAYYVVEGRLKLRVGDDRFELGPGDMAVAPPGTAYGYSTGANEPARFLGLHAPGGFERFLPELYGEGAHDPSANDEPIVLLPGEGERVGETIIKAARPELSLLEFDIEPGGSVDLHFHKLQSDSFYVLEGELEFQVGDRVVRAPAGSFVLAPQNVVHRFRNVRDSVARALNIHTPGGFAEYRRELSALRAASSEPDDAFFERHDIYDV
jgi:quercetin dioxygenase-like cupin family protein